MKRSHRRPTHVIARFGSTLIEVLVVIAIIGILIAILLPAVQAARESSRATQCRNNLHQFGIAFQAHEAQFKYFPAGGLNFRDPPTYVNGAPAVGASQKAGWGFQVLPYLEGTNTWNTGALAAIGTPHPVFFCPTRRAAQTVEINDPYIPSLTGTVITTALCDYAASNREGTGVVRQLKPTRFADLRDGASATLVISEKRLNLAFLGQPQPDDNEGYTAGWNSDTVRRTLNRPRPDFSGTGTGRGRFGSSHPGVFYGLFADGSVRTISYSVDSTVFKNLGDRNDGQPLSADAY